MGWTAPKTWSAGETLTAANFNTHIRDNQLAMGPHLIVRKTADESDAVGTLQNDDILFTPSIAANEVWLLEWLLSVTVTTGGLQARVTFPSGTFSGTISGISNNVMMSGTSSPTATAAPDVNNNTAGQIIVAHAVFSNGATPGAVTLQWARDTSGTTTVKANSTLWGVKLA